MPKLKNLDSLVGTIILLHCPFTTPPKNKFIILLSANPDPILFMINSDENPFIENNPALHTQQIKIRQSDYGFLDHDSFVNCSEAITLLSVSEIMKQVNDDPTRIKGKLIDSTKTSIRNVVKRSTTLSGVHKDIIRKNIT